jgi:ABC-type dipeptide/oligopeptide/nickel transport system permease component
VLKFILHRALATVPVLFLLSVIVFSLIHPTPGDPVLIMLGEENDPQAQEALRRELGLDRPIVEQFLRWLWRLLQGDFGRSLRSHQPVLEAVGERLPVTIELTLLALALAAILSPSLSNVMLAMGVGGVPTYARLVRGQVLSVREWEFVQAARAGLAIVSACSRIRSMPCSSFSSSHRSVVPQGHWMAFSTPDLISHASLLAHTRL